MIYEERNTSFDELGKWETSKDGKTLNLLSSEGAREQWAIHESNTLHKLDANGHEIESKLNFDLHRSEKFSPIEPKLKLLGMYSYTGNAGLFRECSTGKRWPVASEKDDAALKAAYEKARQGSGEGLLVTVQGQVVSRPKTEEQDGQMALIVEKFLNSEPGKTCEDRFSSAPLENTQWKLTDLGETPIMVAAERRRPDIILQSEDQRVAGFACCNRLTGGYELKGESLVFARMATTRMPATRGWIRKLLSSQCWKKLRPGRFTASTSSCMTVKANCWLGSKSTQVRGDRQQITRRKRIGRVTARQSKRVIRLGASGRASVYSAS